MCKAFFGKIERSKVKRKKHENMLSSGATSQPCKAGGNSGPEELKSCSLAIFLLNHISLSGLVGLLEQRNQTAGLWASKTRTDDPCFNSYTLALLQPSHSHEGLSQFSFPIVPSSFSPRILIHDVYYCIKQK